MSSHENVLELFLDDIYNNECVFQINDDEVDFIKSGIEQIVHMIVNKILKYDPLMNHCDDLQKVRENLKDDIQYFTSKGGKINRIFECTTNEIIKVGSFYEGTRNRFPDEFDFIFPVYCIEETECLSHSSATVISSILDEAFSIVYHKILPQVLASSERNNLSYISSDEKRKIVYERIIGFRGPARKLLFFYFNTMEQKREISVDLVPAAVINESQSNFERIVKAHCRLEPFHQFVLSTGNVLFVQGRISFTKAEVYFMKEILSPIHSKVYRVLKYLINDHGDSACYMTQNVKEYSSYIIKTFIIRHHFKCEHAQAVEYLANNCILEVLEDMCLYKDTERLPMIVYWNSVRKEKNRKLFLLPGLQSLLSMLETMNTSIEMYNHQRHMAEFRSVSAQYKFERTHSGQMDGQYDYPDGEIDTSGVVALFSDS